MTEEGAVVDYPVLLAGVLAGVRGGQPPLPAVRTLMRAMVAALGADCGSLVGYDEDAGHVIATTPRSDWALGRPIDPRHPLVVRLSTEPVVEFDLARDVPPELAGQCSARGVSRSAAVGLHAADGRLVGSLQMFFPAGAGPLGEDQRTVLLLGAQLVDRIYPLDRSRAADGPLVAALADGLAVLGPDGLVRSWNPAAQVLTGIPAREAVGRPVPFAVPPVGQVDEHELPDGRWLQVLCSGLADSELRVVTFRDITAVRRRAQLKDLFVATASHELRTPVTVIRGYADMLHRRWDQLAPDARRDAVRVVRDRAERLAMLLDRFLVGDEDRVESLLSPRAFDLGRALRAVVPRLGAEEATRLVVDLPGTLPAALGDPDSVVTVLTELVENAHRYSPDGGEVTLTAGADAQTVYFRVADCGIGVQADHVEQAFDRFWQAEPADGRRLGGVGLGLYLVRRIVESQHGWVSLRRRIPDGTVAEVRLPRAGVTSGEA
ncbi:MAG: ATP-binding protein [Actinocatenispora sp.]